MTTDATDTRSDADAAGHQDSWWATTWPLDKSDGLHLAIALISVIAVGVVIGELLTNWSVLDWIVQTDRDVARNLADGRTETGNDLAHWSAFIADTPVKIALSVVVAGLFLWRWKRWHEAVMVGLTLIFEATAFIIITYIVQRPRPDVERLLESPVNSSFPSGHVAAATVYGALAVIVFWHTRAVWARALAVALAVAAPLAVAWARAYQGMHFLSDVIAGIVLGVVSIYLCARILGPPPDAVSHATADSHATAERDIGTSPEVAA